MTRFHKFFRYPRSRRLLLLRSLPIVAAMRLALLAVPFSTLRRLNTRNFNELAYDDEPRREIARQCSWAVRNAGRLVPGASCLTQALALQRLLKGYGIRSAVRLGVAKSPDGSLAAHAWLEHGDEVFIGGKNLERFTYITDLDMTTA